MKDRVARKTRLRLIKRRRRVIAEPGAGANDRRLIISGSLQLTGAAAAAELCR